MKFSVASWLQAAIAFISVPIVTRAFSPEEFGKINMFTLAVTIISILVGLSMDQSYFRFFNENNSEDSRKKMLTQFIGICCIMYVIFLLLNFLFGRLLSVYLFGEYNGLLIYLALPIMVAMTIISSYQQIYFRMSENALGYTVLSVFIVFATKISLVFAALFQSTYTLGILFIVLGLSLTSIGCKVFSVKSFEVNIPVINKKQIIPYLQYSLPLLPVAVIAFFNSFIIRFLLKDYISFAALGIFTASMTIAGLLSLIQSGFTSYWTPFMYANYKTENALIKKIHSGVSFLMISFALLLIVFSDLIFIILGGEYRGGKNIFALLLISPVVYTISETTCYGIYINKKTHLQFYATIYSFFVTTLLGFTLIPYYGIFGAGIANAAGGIVFFIARTYYGLKEYKSAERLLRTYIAIGIVILAGLINYWISDIYTRSILNVALLLIIFLMYQDILRVLHTLFSNLLDKYKNILKN